MFPATDVLQLVIFWVYTIFSAQEPTKRRLLLLYLAKKEGDATFPTLPWSNYSMAPRKAEAVLDPKPSELLCQGLTLDAVILGWLLQRLRPHKG